MAVRQPTSLRPVLSTAGVSLGFAIGGIGHTDMAQAQEAATGQPARTQGAAVTLDTVVVTTSDGQSGPNTNTDSTGLSRLPGGTVFETPREVQVIPQDIIRQQQAHTLQEALRNVPGITLSTGEGRGGASGDQFRMRGLMVQGDIYRDGLREFGSFTHDNFNTESVEVVKGPSGDGFGVGSVGGLINQSTKRAHLRNETLVEGSIGTGTLARLQLDANRVIGTSQALRFNLMAQDGDMPDRDNAKANRLGLAVDWGAGIGSGTEYHLSYSYLRGRGRPDMGQPLAEGSDGIYRPLLEFDVPGYDRDVSYIRSTDRDDTDVHTVTSALSHDMGNGWTLTNDTRLMSYERDFSATNPAGCDAACLASLRAGVDVELGYGAGGGMTYSQEGWGIQNVLAAKSQFQTGTVSHRVQVGLDLNYTSDRRRRGSWAVDRSGQTILNPVFDSTGEFVWDNHRSKATAFNAGLFVSDRMDFGNGWKLQAAARLDHFTSDFEGVMVAGTERLSGSTSSTEISPSLSVIYEPSKDVMGYFTLSRSYRPLGTDIASAVGAFASEVPASDADFRPERSDLIELGGKMNLLNGRLGLTGAIFQVDKRNSYVISDSGEVEGAFLDAGQNIRIRGVELGAAGEITAGWNIAANYAYLDGEIRPGRGVEDYYLGKDPARVPRHNFALWTTYTVPQTTAALPGQLSVGGGIRYASDYWAEAENYAKVPETFSLDAVVAYEQDNWRLALNAYNLTDHDNYASVFAGSRAVPEAGRSFAVSLSNRF